MLVYELARDSHRCQSGCRILAKNRLTAIAALGQYGLCRWRCFFMLLRCADLYYQFMFEDICQLSFLLLVDDAGLSLYQTDHRSVWRGPSVDGSLRLFAVGGGFFSCVLSDYAAALILATFRFFREHRVQLLRALVNVIRRRLRGCCRWVSLRVVAIAVWPYLALIARPKGTGCVGDR